MNEPADCYHEWFSVGGDRLCRICGLAASTLNRPTTTPDPIRVTEALTQWRAGELLDSDVAALASAAEAWIQGENSE